MCPALIFFALWRHLSRKNYKAGHINYIFDEYKVDYCGYTRAIGSHLVLILFKILWMPGIRTPFGVAI